MYTLAEAKRMLAAQECGRYGHSWEASVNAAGEIVFLFCSNDCQEQPKFTASMVKEITNGK